MLRFQFVGMFVVLCFAGCGSSGPAGDEKPYDPEEHQGQVDLTLAPALQAKQRALKEVLDLIQFGENIDNLDTDIDFEESSESFREGNLGLLAWKFNGKPSGSDVPVKLVMRVDDANHEKVIERVYTVTGSGQNIEIRRKS